MVLTQLVGGDVHLLGCVIGGLQDLIAEPLVAGSSGQHAAHEMPAAVGMGKCMERIVGINAELVSGDEDGAGSAQGDVAAACAHNAGTHSSSGVVAGAAHHLCGSGDAQCGSHFGQDSAYHFIAFVQAGHLLFGNAADLQHFLAPALVLHVQQQHTGSIGIVTAMHTGEDIVDVVLGQHDLCDLRKVLRLFFLHPQDLGSCEAGEGDVGSEGRQLLLADDTVQVINLLGGTAVIPQDGGADDIVLRIQNHQTVHLAAAADTGHLAAVKTGQQFGNTFHNGLLPVLGGLLAPAGIGEFQGIFFGDCVHDPAFPVHQQQLGSGGAQINTDIIHTQTPLRNNLTNPILG